MAERIVIVGAGPAGMRAAEVLADHGARPVVLDEAPASGGQIYRRQPDGFTRGYDMLYGLEAGKARRLHRAFDALGDRIDHRPGSLVWGIEGRHLLVLRNGLGETVPFDRLLLATGATDRVIPLPGWTLPGVYTLGGAQVALKHQGCAVGRRVAFMGANPLLPLVALQYAQAGADVEAVLDTTPWRARLAALPGLAAGGSTAWKGFRYVGALAARGIVYRHGVTPLAVQGGDAVQGLAYRDAAGRRRRVSCDAVAFGYGLKCEWQLADLAGCDFEWDTGTHQWRVVQDALGRGSADEVYLAGDGAGIAGADVAELAGERAARAILLDGGDHAQEAPLERVRQAIAAHAPLRRAIDRAFPFPAGLAASVPDDCVLCRCEAVSAGALRTAVRDLGADDVNRAKAFSRVGMGRCQGRVCGPAACEIVAHELGCSAPQAGRLRSQPPVKPLPIAAFAEPRDVAAA